MRYNRIGVDIDDCVRDFMETVYRVYFDIYPEHRNLVKPINGWSMIEAFPIGEKIYDFIFDEYADRIFYEDARVYPDAGAGLYKLSDAGHKLIAITAQRPTCSQYTKKFFDYYELPFTETHILELDDAYNMSDKTKIPVDIMLDDNVEVLMSFYTKGTDVVCMSKSWNVPFHKQFIELGIPIVSNFSEFVGLVEKREAEYAS